MNQYYNVSFSVLNSITVPVASRIYDINNGLCMCNTP